MVEFNGLGHSAAIHTRQALAKTLVQKSSNAYYLELSIYSGGDVYNAFIPSLTRIVVHMDTTQSLIT